MRLVVAAVTHILTGTHFRFGTIYYESLSSSEARFTIDLAFRRDYTWSIFFDEAYTAEIDPATGFPTNFVTGSSFTFPETDGLGNPVDYTGQTPGTSPYFLRFPVGMTFLGNDLVGGYYGSNPAVGMYSSGEAFSYSGVVYPINVTSLYGCGSTNLCPMENDNLDPQIRPACPCQLSGSNAIMGHQCPDPRYVEVE